ncbi:MAG: AI-2E family transporter [Chromatiales bacterium]|nr:AI-2E family transporter [Chromatiales bacterium]
MLEKNDNPIEAGQGSAVAAPISITAKIRERSSLALNGLFVLAALVALAEAREVFLPLATAFLLSFVFRPIVRALHSIRVPPPVTALLLVGVLGAGLTLGIYSLKEPAAEWLKEAPQSLRQLQYRIAEIREPISDVKAATDALDDLRNGSETPGNEVVLKTSALDEVLFVETSATLMAVFTTLVVLFFVLGWGDRLFRNIVSALPRFRDRREAVVLVKEVEHSITVYLATISLINLVLGIVVAVVMHLLGMPNPLLWGVVAGVLNYIPYLGPAITAIILAFAAVLSFPTLGEALVVPTVFLMITAIEGNFITPYAVGSQLTLNPLLIFLSLLLWFWMWGIIGALLTVPILVCVKAVLDHAQGDTASLARILD